MLHGEMKHSYLSRFPNQGAEGPVQDHGMSHILSSRSYHAIPHNPFVFDWFNFILSFIHSFHVFGRHACGGQNNLGYFLSTIHVHFVEILVLAEPGTHCFGWPVRPRAPLAFASPIAWIIIECANLAAPDPPLPCWWCSVRGQLSALANERRTCS